MNQLKQINMNNNQAYDPSIGYKHQTVILKKCLQASERNGFLYTDEEIHQMKKELRDCENHLINARREEKNGFGWTRKEVSQATPIELQEHL